MTGRPELRSRNLQLRREAIRASHPHCHAEHIAESVTPLLIHATIELRLAFVTQSTLFTGVNRNESLERINLITETYLTRVTHGNGWVPSVCTSYMSQKPPFVLLIKIIRYKFSFYLLL